MTPIPAVAAYLLMAAAAPRPSPASGRTDAPDGRPTRAAKTPATHSPAGRPNRAPTSERPVRISLVAAGDVIFGRMYGRKLANFGYSRPFQHVRGFIAKHDIAMCNLETPITSKRYRWMAKSILVFRALPQAARLLRQGGFNLVVTANNHSRDQGDRGLLETLSHLRRVPLNSVGTGRSLSEAWKPYIFEKNGVKVGVIAFTNIRNYNRPMRRGYFAFASNRRLTQVLTWRIKNLKKTVDFVVVVGHYGEEWKHGTSARERRWVRAMARAGCDLFIGHHPHVLRGIQRIGRMVAYYSLGNFMFDLDWPAVRQSGLARVTFVKDAAGPRLEQAGFIPVHIGSGYRPRIAVGATARGILDKMLVYSKLPGPRTAFLKASDRLFVVLPPAPAR